MKIKRFEVAILTQQAPTSHHFIVGSPNVFTSLFHLSPNLAKSYFGGSPTHLIHKFEKKSFGWN